MKKYILLLTAIVILIYSCNESEQCNSCRSYYDAIESGDIVTKSSSININQMTFDLDFVRPGEYKGNVYCFGNSYSKSNIAFKKLVSSFTDKYNIDEEVFGIEFFGEKHGFCDELPLTEEDVKSFLIYRFSGGKIYADITNMATREIQTYEIFEIRSSVSHYILTHKAGVHENHVIARVTNPNFKYKSEIIFDKNKKGTLYWLANDKNAFLGSRGNEEAVDEIGLEECPDFCLDGPEDDCSGGALDPLGIECSSTFDPNTCPLLRMRTQIKDISLDDKELSDAIASEYDKYYTLRNSVLDSGLKGKSMISKYYTLGLLIPFDSNIEAGLSRQILGELQIHKSKIQRLAYKDIGDNSILYSSSDASNMVLLLNDLRNQSTNPTVDNLVQDLINDINYLADKPLRQILDYVEI